MGDRRPSDAATTAPSNCVRALTNRAYKHWPEIFNHDATLTSAVLDRLLHHAVTVTLEGKSFRMKDVIER